MWPWVMGRVRQVSSRHRRQAVPSFIADVLLLQQLGPKASRPPALPTGATKTAASKVAAGAKLFQAYCLRDTPLGFARLNARRVSHPHPEGKAAMEGMGLPSPAQHAQAGRDAKSMGQLHQNLGVLLGLIPLGKIAPANMSCTNLMLIKIGFSPSLVP